MSDYTTDGWGASSVYEYEQGVVHLEWPEVEMPQVSLRVRDGIADDSTLAHAYVTELRRAGWTVEPPAETPFADLARRIVPL